MTSVVLFGIGKIADVVRAHVADEGGLEIRGFTCDKAYLTRETIDGLPVVPFEDVEAAFPPATHQMLVAIGYHDLNAVRESRCRAALAKGYRLASWVSPRANVTSSSVIGENCVVMPGAALQPYSRLGNGSFVWDNAVIGHHATIGEQCWIASNSTISSTAVLGDRCFVGVNVAIGHGITVGADTFFGAGVVLTHNAAEGGVYIQGDASRYRLDSRRFMRFARMT